MLLILRKDLIGPPQKILVDTIMLLILTFLHSSHVYTDPNNTREIPVDNCDGIERIPIIRLALEDIN